MSGAARAVEAARFLQSAMLATQAVRIRHRVPNSWQALAILSWVEPGRTWLPRDVGALCAKPTYALKALCEAGLIEEAGAAHDGRCLPLRLTERGAEVAGELRRALGGVG